MNTDLSRYIPDLEPGQKVQIKSGPFGGMDGVVTTFQNGGNAAKPTILLRLEVSVQGGIVPVEFTNPTEADLECIDNPPANPLAD